MPEWLTNIPADFWLVLGQMAPYLLFGFLVAGVLSVLVRPEFVERHLGGRGIWAVLKASAFGVPLPLCSCGVIPVAASIRRHGASKGATTAFLISTPQTGVDSILATFGLLGPVFAVYRPLAALVSGLLGGAVVSAAENGAEAPGPSEKCQDACCAPGAKRGKISNSSKHTSLPVLITWVESMKRISLACSDSNTDSGTSCTGFSITLARGTIPPNKVRSKTG